MVFEVSDGKDKSSSMEESFSEGHLQLTTKRCDMILRREKISDDLRIEAKRRNS